MLAVFGPVEPGLNVTVTSQLTPETSALGQLFF